MKWLTRQQAQQIDSTAINTYGLLGLVLMENAGRGVAEKLVSLGIQGTVTICVGKGNNGGDGLVIARHLQNFDVDVRVLLSCPPHELQGDALVNYRILKIAKFPFETFSAKGLEPDALPGQSAALFEDTDWIVDCLLGTGAHGNPREPLASLVKCVNLATGCRIMAVDLPSGLDCDLGTLGDPTIRADHTCTFVAPKIGFASEAAQNVLGQVHIVDIGLPRAMLQQL